MTPTKPLSRMPSLSTVEIIQVKVICHLATGKSKGYGFVKFSSETEAAAALEKMSDEVLDGRNIRVDYTNRR